MVPGPGRDDRRPHDAALVMLRTGLSNRNKLTELSHLQVRTKLQLQSMTITIASQPGIMSV